MNSRKDSAAQTAAEAKPAQSSVKVKSRRVPVFFTLVVLVLIVLLGYLYTKYDKLKASSGDKSEAEAAKVIAEVGKLMVLPQDEVPTIATVTDVDKLSDQAFFDMAKNGDKVLIYTGAKKAILYDPVAKKIVEVAPINIGDSAKSSVKPAPKPVTTPPAESSTATTATP